MATTAPPHFGNCSDEIAMHDGWSNLPKAGKAFLIAGSCTASLAVLMGLYLIVQHLRYYSRPVHQRYIVRIILMVPIYAIYSVLSLVFFTKQVYFALLRDTYEAYVIYQFFALCVNYGGGNEDLELRLKAHPPMGMPEPFCCVKAQPGRSQLRWCRRGILQYVYVRPTMSILAAILYAASTEKHAYYRDGDLSPSTGYLWITIINNISVTISLYYLVFFYQMAKDEMAPFYPLLKFGCIKFVVFFSFWQMVLLAILVKAGVIKCLDKDDPKWDASTVGTGIQNFLICVEMLVVSILHIYAFPYAMYKVRYMSQAPLIHQVEMGSWLKSVTDSANQRDVLADSFDAFVPRVVKNKMSAKPAPRTSEGDLMSNAAPEPVAPLSPAGNDGDLDHVLQEDDAALRVGRR